MVWAAFSRHGVGPICNIDRRMDQYVYQNILLNTMMPYAEDNMPLRWSFMHDNEPKLSSRLVMHNFIPLPVHQSPQTSR